MSAPQQHPLAPLAAYRQFITVKLIPHATKPGKTEKLPVSPYGLVGVDAHDPANWQTWQDAALLAQGLGPDYTVGFDITAADPFWCLDIDGALMPDGAWSPLALQLCAALPGTVVEVSQSGRGLHIWGAGPVPEHGKKNKPLNIEFYSSGRFIALGSGHVGAMVYPNPHVAAVCAQFFPPRAEGGDIPDDGPREDWVGPESDDELIQRALGSRSLAGAFSGKASFADLWNCNAEVLIRSYPDKDAPGEYDASSVDMALAQHLAFWTGCDVARMERLMRRSALVRDKWDDHSTYLVHFTIEGACRLQSDVYRDPAEVERRARAAAVQAAPSTPGPTEPAIAATAGAVAVNEALPNMRNGVGLAATSARVALDTVRQGVRELQLLVAHDEFTGRTTLQDMSEPSSVPRALEDHDAILIRERMGLGGAKPVKADMMKDVLRLEAQVHRYDSANQWLQKLQWDGMPRIDALCPRYLGSLDNAYTRAIGAYWMTALAGRVLVPGCQADMVPVLVGAQGAGKSTGALALCPHPDYFGALDLSERDSDLCRMMNGKLIVELSELAGLRKKDREAVKALITRRDDEWVPKYMESSRKHLRRFIFIGTTNENEFLDDPSGERRWLPFEVGHVDVAAIQRDRDQLWAEGAVRFAANGVEWRQAQTLAQQEHGRFAISDELAEPIAAYLATRPGPARSADIFGHVFHRLATVATREELQRIARVMRSLGYEKKDCRHLGMSGKPWVRVKP